ncbi:MAG: endo-1,4-beta-xylanase, partial [Agathobacter sp.]|nr:endo-1,4-beta-xylanase [Agathobacter sp.]
MTSEMGDDFIVGTAINGGILSDNQAMQLVTTHFNAITLENELKPESMLGGWWVTRPQTETVTLNGKQLVVPKLNYSGPEAILNYIYDWNQKHPDRFIKVRGHVLVWHNQTPEWFFHEDYDAGKPYVDAATMTLRLEWYIKSVAEHFTGKDSKYKDMFYGWDVVNEAVSDGPGSDGTGTYRKDTDNPSSSWWKIYKSNKFITDAFVFANKYMPKSVELYYNDYNEFMWIKPDGIVKLLKAVKDTPGARIDGMGMQGHYSTDDNWPNVNDFKKAVRAYCAVVDHVQLTEFDMALSDSDAQKSEEA